MAKNDLEQVELAKIAISHGFKALNQGNKKAADFIPRLVEIAAAHEGAVANEFKTNSKETPLWYFVRWIN